jgi:hypothetical protein
MIQPTTEQRLVQVLLRATQTTLRVRRAQGSSAALRNEADAALQLAFAPVWARIGQLELEVAPEAIRFEGMDVLARDRDPTDLVASLADAGIRTLTLTPGAEIEEIKLVLTAVASPGDLLTSLFRADLHYIEYSLADEPGTEGPAPTPAAPPSATPAAVREAVRVDAAAPSRQGIVRLEKFDSTLYFLDDMEIEYLKSAVDRVYLQDLASNVVSLLLDILELRSDAETREEVVGVLEDLLTHLLAEGRFEAVARLVAGVRESSRVAAGLTEAHKQRLDRLRASISQPRALSQLFHALEGGGVHPTSQSMGALLRELRPEAIRQMLAWSERLSDAAVRAAVVGALDGFFNEWPQALSRMIQAPERDVIQAGLQLAARLRHPDFVDIVSEVGAHDDPRVRLAVAEALAAIGSAPALRRLTPMGDDTDREVRTVVYRTLTSRPFRPAFGTLRRAIESRDLEDRGQREKRALFEAFGGIAGGEGFPVLEPLLRGRNASGPRPSSHTRACAAIALGIIGTPEARAALSRATSDKDPLVRSAVGAALRGDVAP